MKLEDFAAKSALYERDYIRLAEIICCHFEIPIPIFDVRDDCPSNRLPTRAVLLMTNVRRSYGFELLPTHPLNARSSGFIFWSWDKNYLDDDDYLLVT